MTAGVSACLVGPTPFLDSVDKGTRVYGRYVRENIVANIADVPPGRKNEKIAARISHRMLYLSTLSEWRQLLTTHRSLLVAQRFNRIESRGALRGEHTENDSDSD